MTDHTFVLADMAGFTALTEAHGDSEAADAAAEFMAACRARLSQHDADEVKTLGDGVLLHTDCASAGLGLAVRLMAELGRRDRRLGLRVAVHTGTAVPRDGDWFGAAVNTVARVSAVVRTGELVATAAALHAAEPGPPATSLGTQRFKHVQLPVELFAVQVPDTPQPMLVDPVCRMALAAGDAPHRARHSGEDYVFCSASCMRRFVEDPVFFA